MDELGVFTIWSFSNAPCITCGGVHGIDPGESWHEGSVAFRDEYRRSFGDFGPIGSHHGLAVLAFSGNHRRGHSRHIGGPRHQCPSRTIDRDRHDGSAGTQAIVLIETGAAIARFRPPLFPYTKAAENLAEQIVTGEFTGDLAQGMLSQPQILGE